MTRAFVRFVIAGFCTVALIIVCRAFDLPLGPAAIGFGVGVFAVAAGDVVLS